MHLEYLACAVLAIIALRVLRDLVRLFLNLKWLMKYELRDVAEVKTFFVLCIPMYREQKIVEETIQYFANLNYPKDKYRIVIATTAKEEASDSSVQSTKFLADQCAHSINKIFPDLVHVVQYPARSGVMSHQINYAAQGLEDILKKEKTYLSVYNADSRPNPNSLVAVDSMIQDLILQGHNPTVLQQSSLFTVDVNKPTIEHWVTAGAAIHQSLWSLRHEISFYRKQSKNVHRLANTKNWLKILRFSRIAHCVGHGLFISGKHFLANPLPEDLLNEDLPYGLLQCCKRQGIYPVPLLETGLSPVKLRELYRQKSVWFNPFFEFYGYAKSIIAGNSHVSRFEVWFLALQAYSSLFIWLVHTLVWVGSFVLAASIGWQYTIVWVVLYLLYWVVPALYYALFLSVNRLGVEVKWRAVLWGNLYVLSHSVGPWWGACRWALALSRGSRPTKPKTDNI